VTPKILPLPNNEVNVVFAINEHAKITVKEVRFVGNRAIPVSRPQGRHADAGREPLLVPHRRGDLPGGTPSSATRSSSRGLYFDQGYIFVKFGKPAIELSPDKRYIFITMSIEEGEPFDVGKIDVGGDLLVPREQLAGRWVVEPLRGAVLEDPAAERHEPATRRLQGQGLRVRQRHARHPGRGGEEDRRSHSYVFQKGHAGHHREDRDRRKQQVPVDNGHPPGR